MHVPASIAEAEQIIKNGVSVMAPMEAARKSGTPRPDAVAKDGFPGFFFA